MARKKINSQSSSNPPPISIGNCEVLVEGPDKSFKCESSRDSIHISASKGTKIKISVIEKVNESKSEGLDELEFRENGKEEGCGPLVDCQFLLINPKDPDSGTKSLLEEILNLYMKELPAMNFAANTGKQSSFLQRCVSNGKFCTLLLREKCTEGSDKVIAAVTYQIIPADTQYAEIPLATVSSTYQHKGIGRVLYTELRKRLQDVGICTVFCWGDEESEGFWQKQGFVAIGEVGTKGRARRLPIKADVRRALCFPGGSTLMVSHLNKNINDNGAYLIKLRLNLSEKSSSSNDVFYSLPGTRDTSAPPISATGRSTGQENLPLKPNVSTESHSTRNCEQLVTNEKMDADMVGDSVSTKVVTKQISSTYERTTKRRVWETRSSSFNSKRVKATHLADYESCPDSVLVLDKGHKADSRSNMHCLGLEENVSTVKSKHVDVLIAGDESLASKSSFNIMLMDIADGPKKAQLTKLILDLGGAVTTNGSLCTHLLTGKVRRTLNFCTALCSGAWILSPHWLKESSREGRFVDELPFILKDEDCLMKFRVDLKDAVLRARKNPRGLLEGYSICLTKNVHPPIGMLSSIVRSAGGDVNVGLEKVLDSSRTIFIACEDDMEEALFAVKSGVRTFSSDWFMTCVMRQELDLDAPQFAESL